MSIPCGTATDPPLCGACPKPATLTCTGCNNMKYCSQECQKRDEVMHKTLCHQFKHFQDEHRPSPDHRRVILFPQDEEEPKFIWLKYEGHPMEMTHNVAELRGLFPNRRAEAIEFIDSHRELGRQWNNTLWMQGDAFAVTLPVNKSLARFLGPYAWRWRGPIVCMAPTKYSFRTPYDDYDDADKDEDESDVLIPYDLDTTSLAVHVACLVFRAKYEGLGCSYSVNTRGVGDGFDPK